MTGTWDDLDRELHVARADAQHDGHDWDVADARAAVARWIGIPEPRRHHDDLDVAETVPPPVALQAAVTDTLPHCLGCDGTCRRCST